MRVAHTVKVLHGVAFLFAACMVCLSINLAVEITNYWHDQKGQGFTVAEIRLKIDPAFFSPLGFSGLALVWLTFINLFMIVKEPMPILIDFLELLILSMSGFGCIGSLSTKALFFSGSTAFGKRGHAPGTLKFAGFATIILGWLFVLYLVGMLVFELVMVSKLFGLRGNWRCSVKNLEDEELYKRPSKSYHELQDDDGAWDPRL